MPKKDVEAVELVALINDLVMSSKECEFDMKIVMTTESTLPLHYYMLNYIPALGGMEMSMSHIIQTKKVN
jgi:hypothetical protein